MLFCFQALNAQRIPRHMISSREAVAVPRRAPVPCVNQAATPLGMPPQGLKSAGVPIPGRRLISRQRGDETVATKQSTQSGAAPGDRLSDDLAHEHCSTLANTRTRKLSRTSTPCLLGTETQPADSDENDGLRKNCRTRRSFSCPTRSRKTQKFATDTVVGRPSEG